MGLQPIAQEYMISANTWWTIPLPKVPHDTIPLGGKTYAVVIATCSPFYPPKDPLPDEHGAEVVLLIESSMYTETSQALKSHLDPKQDNSKVWKLKIGPAFWYACVQKHAPMLLFPAVNHQPNLEGKEVVEALENHFKPPHAKSQEIAYALGVPKWEGVQQVLNAWKALGTSGSAKFFECEYQPKPPGTKVARF